MNYRSSTHECSPLTLSFSFILLWGGGRSLLLLCQMSFLSKPDFISQIRTSHCTKTYSHLGPQKWFCFLLIKVCVFLHKQVSAQGILPSLLSICIYSKLVKSQCTRYQPAIEAKEVQAHRTKAIIIASYLISINLT